MNILGQYSDLLRKIFHFSSNQKAQEALLNKYVNMPGK